MPASIIFVAIAGFLLMAIVSLVAPTRVTRQFDIPILSIAGRNEVRAVYGGFGLAVAAVMLAAIRDEALRPGILVAVAAALAGMASGRIISALIDREIGRAPTMYLGIEAVTAALLFYIA